MEKRFITFKDVVRKVCLSRSAIYTRMKAGVFPESIALGPKKIVFLESEIDAWMDWQASEAALAGDEMRVSKSVAAITFRHNRKHHDAKR